jgi:hypothetical protein
MSDKAWSSWDRYIEVRHQRASCAHVWTEPKRAPNRFGRMSTSLYQTTCSRCGEVEIRNGKARLIREVIDVCQN